MKSSILIFIQLFCWSFLFSQNSTLYLYAEDNVGNKDTVAYGFNEMSTIGIDTIFGEKNIYNQPNGSLDMRFILRDSLNSGCLNLNFSENIDLKTDFRPFSSKKEGYLQFYSLANIFELNIKAIEYPVTITSDLSESFFRDWSHFELLQTDCTPFLTYEPLNTIETDTLVLPDSTFTTIVFHMEHDVGIENFINPTWKVFPNPSKQWIKLTDSKPFNGSLEILNIGGKIIYRRLISNKIEITTNISNFATGVYLVKYANKDKTETSIRKLIKD